MSVVKTIHLSDKLGDIPLTPKPTLLPATVVHKDSVVFIRT